MLLQDLLSLGHRIKRRFPAPVRSLLIRIIRPLNARSEKNALKRLYRTFLSAGDLSFDVGAHSGTMSEIMLELGCRVVAIDPQPACVRTLTSKFKGRPDISVEPVGVADAEGELSFTVCETPMSSTFNSDVMKSRFPDLKWHETLTVPVTTLDRLIQKHGRPSYCKIDVEGFELQVLKGLTQPIPFVSIEFHGKEIDRARQCAERLLELGPVEFQVSLYDRHRFHLPNWATLDELFAFLSGFRSETLHGDIYARSVTA